MVAVILFCESFVDFYLYEPIHSESETVLTLSYVLHGYTSNVDIKFGLVLLAIV